MGRGGEGESQTDWGNSGGCKGVRNMLSPCLAKASLELDRIEERERMDSNKCK